MRTFKFKAVSVAISMALALALPFGVMAADGFGDGAAVDAEWDDSEAFDYNEDSDIVSEVGDDFGFFGDDDFVTEAVSDGGVDSGVEPTIFLVEESIRFYFNNAIFPDYTVTYETHNVLDDTYQSYTLPAKAVLLEDSHVPATCEEPGKFKLKVAIPDYENTARTDKMYVSDYFYLYKGAFDLPAEPALGHDWYKQVINAEETTYPTCETTGVVTYDWSCSRCTSRLSGYAAKQEVDPVVVGYPSDYTTQRVPLTTSEKEKINRAKQVREAVGHDYQPVVFYLLNGVGDRLEKAPELNDGEFYLKVTAQVCQNIKNEKCDTCEAPVKEIKIERYPNEATVTYTNPKNIQSKDITTNPKKDFFVYSEDIQACTKYPFPYDFNDIELIDHTKPGYFDMVWDHSAGAKTFTLKTTDNEDGDFEKTTVQAEVAQEGQEGQEAEEVVRDKNVAAEVDRLVQQYKDVADASATKETITVPAHHTILYFYTMTDVKLAGTVDDYVIFENADGTVISPAKGVGFAAKEKVSIKASRYCVPFDVTETQICYYYDTVKKVMTTHVVGTEIKTAEATPDQHLIDKKVYDELFGEDGVNTETDTKGTQSLADYEKYIKANAKYIKELSNTATCTKTGKAEVQFICTLCGADTQTKATIKISPVDHKWETKRENIVEPTCSAAGSFDSVQVCARCGERRTLGSFQVKKLDHVYSNTPVVTFNGELVVDPETASYLADGKIGTDISREITKNGKTLKVVGYSATQATESDYYVSPTAKLVCVNCGHLEDIESTATITLDAISKEGTFCQQGEVTLSARITPKQPAVGENEVIKKLEDGTTKIKTAPVSVTKTFPYYSSLSAYQGRTAHSYGDPVIENVVPATETAAGSHDLVVYCKVCGYEAFRRTLVDAPIDHVHKLEKVEAKAATCTEAGNIEYWVCTDEKCGAFFKDEAGTEQITQEETVVAALGHTLELVEAKDPTCVAGHKAYYVCTVCTKMYSDEAGTEEVIWDELKIEPTEEHTPGEAVVETRDDGKYSVVYCSRCGIEISAEPYVENPLLPGPKTFNLKANKPNAGYMEFKLGEVEGAEKYRVSYRIAGTKEYTRQESDTNVVKITDLERGQVYDFTACAGDVLEDGQIQWGARALRKDGAVKYARRWYETVEQSKIAKEGTVITLEWTALEDASKYVISIADNKQMKNAVKVNAAVLNPTVVDGKVQVSADITTIPDFNAVPAGSQMKFYVRIRPYTEYDGKNVAGALSNLRAKTIKF